MSLYFYGDKRNLIGWKSIATFSARFMSYRISISMNYIFGGYESREKASKLMAIQSLAADGFVE